MLISHHSALYVCLSVILLGMVCAAAAAKCVCFASLLFSTGHQRRPTTARIGLTHSRGRCCCTARAINGDACAKGHCPTGPDYDLNLICTALCTALLFSCSIIVNPFCVSYFRAVDLYIFIYTYIYISLELVIHMNIFASPCPPTSLLTPHRWLIYNRQFYFSCSTSFANKPFMCERFFYLFHGISFHYYLFICLFRFLCSTCTIST